MKETTKWLNDSGNKQLTADPNVFKTRQRTILSFGHSQTGRWGTSAYVHLLVIANSVVVHLPCAQNHTRIISISHVTYYWPVMKDAGC